MDKNFSNFEKKIGIKFKNSDLLCQVFVHRSFLNENPSFKLEHNERLEFLGDAVLELITTEYLYKNFPNPEGELTNWRSALVKGEMLAKVAGDLAMSDYLYLSRGEAKSGGKGRQIIMANALEALIGAIYLDQKMEKAKDFVNRYILGHLPEILELGLHVDAKSRLQELVQEREGFTPNYRVIGESGPDHDKRFIVGVFVNDRMIGEGAGASKQAAEQVAASKALERY
ncbi:MAG: ribonuclease III [bacterium]|nr:ribonuclease III [bacterium]